MKYVIPRYPDALSIVVNKLWSGKSCSDDRVHATVEISTKKDTLLIRAEAPVLHDQSIPDAPIGSRVEKLWTYDVVEVFLVGPGHQYVEIELGAGGHFLLLEFDRIRHRSNEFLNLRPLVRHKKTPEKTWVTEIEVPLRALPENLRAMNAFMIASGQFLAHTAVPGDKPDFHQPDYFVQTSFV